MGSCPQQCGVDYHVSNWRSVKYFVVVGWRKSSAFLLLCMSPQLAVRPEGADHQWRKIPPRELSIDLVADERFGRVTGGAGAS
jgi:hypothetical protein